MVFGKSGRLFNLEEITRGLQATGGQGYYDTKSQTGAIAEFIKSPVLQVFPIRSSDTTVQGGE